MRVHLNTGERAGEVGIARDAVEPRGHDHGAEALAGASRGHLPLPIDRSRLAYASAKSDPTAKVEAVGETFQVIEHLRMAGEEGLGLADPKTPKGRVPTRRVCPQGNIARA